jgi:M6 family metalloprotease-like protein
MGAKRFLAALTIALLFGGTQGISSGDANVRGGSHSGVSALRLARKSLGTQRWATILCRFRGNRSSPHSRTWFRGLMSARYPGLQDYWEELSYGKLTYEATDVFGWYRLPKRLAAYGGRSQSGIELYELATDCARVANREVSFIRYDGINFMFNDYWGTANGGSVHLHLDGRSRSYRSTWVPAPAPADCRCGNAGFDHQGIVVSEMVHALGVGWHTSGPYGETYDSGWDVGSTPSGPPGTYCSVDHRRYGCVGVHIIAWHKRVMGWIPKSRTFVPDAETSTTITLHPLSGPMPSSGYLWAKILIEDSSTRFYTVEARRRIGYDKGIPGEAVVIHKVNTKRADRKAQVVDPDNDGNPNDQGAMWKPGETFKNGKHGITVHIEGEGTDAEFLVTITLN